MPGSREGGGFRVWLSLRSLTSMSCLGAAYRGCAAPGLVVTSSCLSQTPFCIICREQLEATSISEAILDILDTSDRREHISHPHQKEKQSINMSWAGTELADAPLTEMRGADILL